MSVRLEGGRSEVADVSEDVTQLEGDTADHKSAVEVQVGHVVLPRRRQQVNGLHGGVEQHLQNGASVVTIAVSSHLVNHLRHPVLFVVSLVVLLHSHSFIYNHNIILFMFLPCLQPDLLHTSFT